MQRTAWNNGWRWLVIGWWLMNLISLPVSGTLTIAPPSSAVTPAETTEQEKLLVTLRGILQSTDTLHEQIREQEQLLKSARTDEQKARINADLSELSRRLRSLEKDFEGIATGIDLDGFNVTVRTTFDWKQEMQEVLGPILEELKRMTARPRELERLRTDVLHYEQRLLLIKNAVQNVRLLNLAQPSSAVKTHLRNIEKKWIELEQETANQLAIAQYLLDEKLREKRPVVESVQDGLRAFFKSRGKNLLLALFAFTTVLLLFRWLHWLIRKVLLMRFGRKQTFYSRLAEVLYHTLTVIGAMSAMIVALYVSGDWVLLGIALIFLFGVAWTAKQGLPMFWEQVKLLLNLSTVRENERVMYNGLPWKVAALNLYSRLHNPALKGGMIRLPSRALLNLQSRPFHKDEPWFPCQENDWVILTDGTFGKVWMQTPEMVQLILPGGNRKTYPTLNFLQQHPNNLSSNFRITLTFGIDYQHQALSTTTIPPQLQEHVQQEFAKLGYRDHLLNLNVEFKSASSSSLDLAILADFSGEAAPNYEVLSRLLQRLAVDACNRHGWVIPFTQITLHTTGASAPAA